MTTWPEFYFDSEFESASEMPNMSSQQVELAEAYSMATKAIHTHRTSFLTLKPQSQRTHLVATAKELAKLVSAKDKAYYRLNRANHSQSQPLSRGIQGQNQPLTQPPKQPESKQPPKSGVNFPIQPRNVAREQLQLQSASKRQPLKVVQPQVRPQAQPLNIQPHNDENWEPQSRDQDGQNRPHNGEPSQPPMQPRKVARVQPPLPVPDLPPDPDPGNKKKFNLIERSIQMPATNGHTSYTQWGKAAPSISNSTIKI